MSYLRKPWGGQLTALAFAVGISASLFIGAVGSRVFAEDIPVEVAPTLVEAEIAPIVEAPQDAFVPEVVIEEVVAPESSVVVVEDQVSDGLVELASPDPVVLAESAAAGSELEVLSSPVSSPELSTEKPDYHPGETATIFGKFFQSLTSFVLKIFGSDDYDNNYTETSEVVTTDESGYFTTSYFLDNLYRPFYQMVASSLDGNVVAEGMFRDSSVDRYDQCSNDDGDGYSSGDTGCRWINGNMQSNNSTYYEGDSTIQRLSVLGLAPGSSHTVTFKYGTTKAGKHAYDYLTTWSETENWVTAADRCEDITGCETASEGTFSIPNDPNLTDVIEPAGSRLFTIRGATITAVSTPTIVSGTYAGDSETAVTVTFTTGPSNGSMCKVKSGVTSCGVVLWFGAHIADGAAWFAHDGTTGAGSISGSPYHVALVDIDGDPQTLPQGGGRDNQMQAGAIVVPEQATLTLVKSVVNNNGGNAVATSWTLNAAGPTPISGATGSGTVTSASVDAGEYNLSESGGPSGYSASQYSCVKNGGQPVSSNSLTLAAGDTATCTITNDDIAPTLILNKVVVNDNGGNQPESAWTLSASGPTPISGPGAAGTNDVVSGPSFSVGTYTLSESGLTGYSAGEWICNGDPSENSVAVGLGETKTCTITNDDIAPKLHLRKVVVNDNGGTATVANFTLTANGTGDNDLSGTSPVDSGATLQADTFALSETSLAGYSASAWSCVGGTQNGANITLGIGQEATCTITNDDIQPKLTLVKTVVNNNGGTLDVADFPLFVNATGVTSGVKNGFNAGSYTASETAQVGYAPSAWGGDCANDGSITLVVGDDKTCTITNDDIAPKLHLRKVVVNDNGGTATVANFTLTANGTGDNDLSGTSPVDSGATLQADTFALSETSLAGYSASAWSCVGGTQNGANITLGIGQEATCTITNDDISPKLTIVKDADPNDCQDFTFSMTGESNFILDDDANVTECLDADRNQSKLHDDLIAGTAYTVTELLPNQYWQFDGVSCVVTNTETPYNFTPATNGLSITLNLADDVTCTFKNKKLSPTRTQGFWQTHTQYTTSVFNAPAYTYSWFVPGSVKVGNSITTQDPIITPGQLFGGFFSNIAKKSTGGGRSALDKARMQLAQQLLAAKLNCAAFGCQSSVQTMIATADANYAGTSTSAILASASALDMYNNSGDTLIIGSAGKATPKDSKAIANLLFWDTP